MSSQAELTGVGTYFQGPSPPSTGMLTLTTVLFVTLAVGGLVLSGGFGSYYATVVPLTALLSGLLGAQAPRFLLKSLFVCAPLLWALGDASVLQGDGARVNLPMFVGFVVVVAFCPLLLVKDADPGVELIRKLVLGLGLVCIPAIFSAQDFFTGAGVYLRIMCPYIVMFATLRHVRDKADVLHYARSMAFALLAVATVLMIAYSRSELWVDFGGYTRLGALHYKTQGFGMYLSVMVFVVMLNYLLTRNRVYLLLLSFPLVALLLTYVRTAWVGGIVMLVLLTFQIKKSYGRRLLLAGLLLSPLFFSVLWQGILRYDTTVDSPQVDDKILNGRLGVDALAIESYLDASLYHKLFGIGFLREQEVTGPAFGEEFVIHDDYLALLVEAGVLPLLVYSAILIVLLKRSRQGKRRARERISYDMCGASFILIVTVMIMGIPRAFYGEVLSNLYIYGTLGLMLSQSRVFNLRYWNNRDAASAPANAGHVS
jgi:O-antigen ligase